VKKLCPRTCKLCVPDANNSYPYKDVSMDEIQLNLKEIGDELKELKDNLL